MSRNNTTDLPRYVKPETLRIGDTIRLTVKAEAGGVTREYVGVIATRQYQGSDRVLFTADGTELLRWNPARKAPGIITLIARAAQPQPMLSIFDGTELEKRLNA